jgi:hypothetical protein
MKIKVIQNKAEANHMMHMSSFRANLGGCISYKDLVDTFGEPTFTPEDSGDGKVNYEWVLQFDGSYFSIYDWKTYDEEYTRNEYTNWHIGGHAGAIDIHNFINAVLDQMRESLFA